MSPIHLRCDHCPLRREFWRWSMFFTMPLLVFSLLLALRSQLGGDGLASAAVEVGMAGLLLLLFSPEFLAMEAGWHFAPAGMNVLARAVFQANPDDIGSLLLPMAVFAVVIGRRYALWWWGVSRLATGKHAPYAPVLAFQGVAVALIAFTNFRAGSALYILAGLVLCFAGVQFVRDRRAAVPCPGKTAP